MTQPSWEGTAGGGGWGPPPAGGGGWPAPGGAGGGGGGGQPAEPGSVSATDALSFAWARLKKDFLGVTGTLFVAHMIGVLPALVITGGAVGYQMSQMRPGHPPDPNDPVMLITQAASTILTWFTQGFISGGVYLYSLKVARGEAYSFGDAFAGGRFFGASFTISALVSLLFVPGSVLSKVAIAAGAPPIAATPILFVCMIPGFFFALAWALSLPIAVDRGLGGLTAMKEIWRITSGHRLSIFLAVLLITLIAIPATCLCCVGLPVVMAMTSLTITALYLRITGQPMARD